MSYTESQDLKGAIKLNPEELQAMLGKQPQDPSQQDPSAQEGQMPVDDGQPMTGGHPMAGQFSPPELDPNAVPSISPVDMLNDLIEQYIEFSKGIIAKAGKELDNPVASKILVEQAQALGTLVPLLTNDAQAKQQEMEMQMQMKQQEMELKKQEHEMNMQMKQAEMGFKQQENEQKLQMNEQMNQQKINQQAENHQSQLVQKQESHESQLQQQKQAAQLKQSSNSSSNQPKK